MKKYRLVFIPLEGDLKGPPLTMLESDDPKQLVNVTIYTNNALCLYPELTGPPRHFQLEVIRIADGANPVEIYLNKDGSCYHIDWSQPTPKETQNARPIVM